MGLWSVKMMKWCFQRMAELLYGFINGHQFEIVCAVFLLDRIEFLGGEGEGLPGVLDPLLQHSAHGGRGGFYDECKWRG
jgi:hypothetical protein